jgi:predicted nucleic acid-binding protein
VNGLSDPKSRLPPESQEDLLQDYLPYAETVALPDPSPALPTACRDVDDDLFLHLAIAAQVDCLVTGDGDLLALAGRAGVVVKSIQDWQAGLSSTK